MNESKNMFTNMGIKNIIMTDRILTRDGTKMIQGLSVLAMVVLHLFDRHDFQGLYYPLLYFMGKPVVFYFAQISDFCVMGFAFCSGYGLYKQYTKCDEKKYFSDRLKGIRKLLVNYWIILIGFSIVSLLIGNGSKIPGTIWEFIENLTTINTSYNGAWWYLFVYIVLVISSPIIFRLCNRLPWWFNLCVAFCIYCSAYYVRFSMVDKNWCITKYGVLGMTYFEFLIGAMVCKNAWLEKIKYCITDKMKKWQKITVAFAIIIGLLIGHTLIVPSLFIAPFTGGIVILIFSIWEKTELIKNTFLFLGKHSTNIWLIHMFFYHDIFVNFVYIGRYPVIILALMLCITILCSTCINYIIKRFGLFKGNKKVLNFYAFPLECVCCIIILLISIWTILEWLLSGRGGKVYLSWRYINIVLYVFSLFLILKMTILGRTVGNREIELLPFYTINTISDNSEAVRMIVMNIILFFPLGLTMPIALGRVKNTRRKWLLCIIVGLGISLSVEIIQYYFCIGIAETDDVICNTFGTLLGVMPNILANYFGKQRKC